MYHFKDIFNLAKNNCAYALDNLAKKGMSLRLYERVETEDSKYRDWGVRAEYENGSSLLDYAVMYNNANAVAAILYNTQNSNDPYSVEELSKLLSLIEHSSISKKIVDLLHNYGGRVNNKTSHAFWNIRISDNRTKYGSNGELIAEYIKAKEQLNNNAFAYTMLKQAEAKTVNHIINVYNDVFEILGITYDMLINDIDAVKAKGITRQDLEFFYKNFIDPDVAKLCDSIIIMNDTIKSAINKDGGLESFPNAEVKFIYKAIPGFCDEKIVYHCHLADKLEEKYTDFRDLDWSSLYYKYIHSVWVHYDSSLRKYRYAYDMINMFQTYFADEKIVEQAQSGIFINDDFVNPKWAPINKI